MKYTINGKEATRTEVQEHLEAELKAAENSPNFQGRIFYNIDYIDHMAKDVMKKCGITVVSYFELQIIAE